MIGIESSTVKLCQEGGMGGASRMVQRGPGPRRASISHHKLSKFFVISCLHLEFTFPIELTFTLGPGPERKHKLLLCFAMAVLITLGSLLSVFTNQLS